MRVENGVNMCSDDRFGLMRRGRDGLSTRRHSNFEEDSRDEAEACFGVAK